jgi:hypothetical protein
VENSIEKGYSSSPGDRDDPQRRALPRTKKKETSMTDSELLKAILSVTDEEKLIRLRRRLQKANLEEAADSIKAEIKRMEKAEKKQ